MSSRFKFFEESVNDQSSPEIFLDKNAIDFRLKIGSNYRFQIEVNSTLYALGNKAIDVKNISVWMLNYIDVTDDGYLIKLTVESDDVFNENPSFDGIVSFSKFFNIPLRELTIKLDSFGNINGIINQQQVIESWQSIKSQILPSLNAEEATSIIENGNSQFENTLNLLKNTFLYNIFFEPVYGIKQKGETVKLETRKFTSQLFQNLTIPYNPLQKVENFDNDNIKFSYHTEILAFDKTSLIKDYNEIYRNVMEGDLNYQIGYTGSSLYDIKTGLLITSRVRFRESVNENLRFECNYEIKGI